MLRLSTAHMKLNQIPYVIFQTLYTPDEKEPIKVKFSDFWVAGWKLTKFQSHLKSQVSFTFSTLDHSSESWELTLLYFFNWNFILFGQKEPIKVWNFYWSGENSSNLYSDKLLLMKYIQFQLEKYNAVTCKVTEELWKIWRGIDLLFQNWHEKFDEYWLEHSKSLKKVYNQSI